MRSLASRASAPAFQVRARSMSVLSDARLLPRETAAAVAAPYRDPIGMRAPADRALLPCAESRGARVQRALSRLSGRTETRAYRTACSRRATVGANRVR